MMMNPDLIQELPKLNYCEQGNKIFVKPGVYPLSSRKLEGFMKIQIFRNIINAIL